MPSKTRQDSRTFRRHPALITIIRINQTGEGIRTILSVTRWDAPGPVMGRHVTPRASGCTRHTKYSHDNEMSPGASRKYLHLTHRAICGSADVHDNAATKYRIPQVFLSQTYDGLTLWTQY
ncbi:hypothetical protein RRG08_043117 [Elysia crispata]|uniref:Uncharacterized protein n=1 Tax=Elysia crispata TaxID=231223 RepID=A0AAE0XYM5_9GAST|nr:hypothetical protein RRG08_043117 [Elysia crispata]